MESKEKNSDRRGIIVGVLVAILAVSALVLAARVPLVRAQQAPSAPMVGQTGCTFGPLGTSCGPAQCTVSATSVNCSSAFGNRAVSDAVTPTLTPPPIPAIPTRTATSTVTATPILAPDCDNDGDPGDPDEASECGISVVTSGSNGVVTSCNLPPAASAQNYLPVLSQETGGSPCTQSIPPTTQVCNNLLLPGQPVPCQALPAPSGDQVCNSGQGPTIPVGLSCPAPTAAPTATAMPTPETYPHTVTVTAGDDIPRIPGRENQPPIGVVITRIGNQATIAVTNNTIDPLDLRRTVIIQTAPGVVATSAVASAGATSVSGSQVVWSNLSLDSGQEASITVNLAATGGGPLAAGGGPVIQSVTVDGSDVQSGEAVAENSQTGAAANLSARASGTYSCQGSSSGSNCQGSVPNQAITWAPGWLREAGKLLSHAAGGLRSSAVP